MDGWKEARHVQAFAWQVYDGTVAGYGDFILPRLWSKFIVLLLEIIESYKYNGNIYIYTHIRTQNVE